MSDTSEPRVPAPTLDQVLVSGLAWTGTVKWVSQALSWVSTLIVARILSPQDYGLIGMSAVYMSLVSVVNESGLGTSVVNNRDLTDVQIAQLNRLCTLLGLAAVLLSSVAALPLAHFFRAPTLTWVVIAMSATFIISSFRTVPMAMLQRDLNFRALALVDGMQALTQASVAVLCAYLGFRFWALVLGAIAGSTVATLVVLWKRRCPYAWPRLSVIGGAFLYGRRILGAQVAWYVVANADFVIIGRILGQAAVGVYSLVFSIAATPVEKITSLVSRVAFPMFSRVQGDHPALRRYLLTLTEGLALACFPLAIGLALEADRFVPVVLGAKWLSATRPLMLLAVLGAVRSIQPLIPQVLNVIGGVRFAMYNGVLMGVVAPIAFYFGAKQAGLVGVATGWFVVFAITSPPIYWAVMSGIHLSLRAYLRALWPAISGCIVMAGAVLAVRQLHAGPAPASISGLLIEVASGAVAYTGTILLVHRRRLSSVLALIRSRGLRADAPAPGPSYAPRDAE
jgi:O-antigen/teichoic acid export membrane protein